jgi:hypothetical protein
MAFRAGFGLTNYCPSLTCKIHFSAFKNISFYTVTIVDPTDEWHLELGVG